MSPFHQLVISALGRWPDSVCAWCLDTLLSLCCVADACISTNTHACALHTKSKQEGLLQQDFHDSAIDIVVFTGWCQVQQP